MNICSPPNRLTPRSATGARLLIGLVAVAAAAAPTVAPAADGVPCLANDASPANGLNVIRLEEMWRVGGEDSEYLFGHIFRAEADGDGNVYLLDTQLSEVQVFGPDGEHLRTLSREGEGPGETRLPADLTMMPDGTLGILQRFPAKVVKVTLDDVPAGDLVLGDPNAGGFNSVFTGRCKGENLMLVAQHSRREDARQIRTWYVSRFDAEGNELARCWSRELVVDFAKPVIREVDILDPVVFGSTAGADGGVYIATDWVRYSIKVYDPEGQLVRVIEREFTPRAKTERERSRIQAVFDAWTSRGPGDVRTEVAPTATTITGLYVDDANNLWVEHSRSAEAGPAEALLTYDVFDPSGKFDRQVALVAEGDPADDRLFLVRDDMAVLVKGAVSALYASMAGGAQATDEEAAAGEMEVVCYRIPR